MWHAQRDDNAPLSNLLSEIVDIASFKHLPVSRGMQITA